MTNQNQPTEGEWILSEEGEQFYGETIIRRLLCRVGSCGNVQLNLNTVGTWNPQAAKDARFIVSAHNEACKINPGNPQAVIDNLGELVVTARRLYTAMLKFYEGAEGDIITEASALDSVLAKLVSEE